MTCVYDTRWFGSHGIGRFARELSTRLPHRSLVAKGRPMSPFDPLRLTFQHFGPGEWFLSPGYNAPLLTSSPYILTLHDLNHIDRPDNSSSVKRLYYRSVLHHLCHKARAVMTVSEFSRQRIVDWFGLAPQQVYSVGNGVSPAFCLDGTRHKRKGDYLLCVSNRRGHKNELGLLSAMSKARLPLGLELVLTGEPSAQLLAHARLLGVADRLVFSGRVSEEELSSLYRGAVGLVFPSLYEGFGLPIVEAFACGTPVITSKAAAMPEIAGDAALLVDPFDIDEMAFALTRLCEDTALRVTLSARGLARVSAYSWDAVASRVRSVVDAVNTIPSKPLSWD